MVLVNHDPRETLRLRRLDRVAQLVVQRVEQVVWRETGVLPDSARGTGGHGSTGGWTDPRGTAATPPGPSGTPTGTTPAAAGG